MPRKAIIIVLLLAWAAGPGAAGEVVPDQALDSSANLLSVSPPNATDAGALELFYNRTRQGTVLFFPFAAALLLLIIAAATSSRIVRRVGLGVFALGAVGLVGGFVVRWIISGRAWYLPPIMNQFEAVTASAMLAALLAFALELFYKRNYFAIAASFYSAVALLTGMMFPAAMGAEISAPHGILDSPIMPAHVAVIIIGHALAGMTLVISVAYIAGSVAAVLRGRYLASAPADLCDALSGGGLPAIDRCNLIVAQLAAWCIAVGTMLGAYWADFAWSRWWGWDPKETWALITALIYLVILQVRFVTPDRWRGLVTSVGCIAGCLAMLFNWIIVNYLLTGLHSYA
jgi:ABC-type transport system involved in cytochrome c biogenesis permease subunit